MFGAKKHEGAPPSYITIETLCERLGMSRQNFYQSGLDTAISSWQVGRVLLFREEDAFQLRYYVEMRKKLIERGILKKNHPLLDEGLWLDVFEGEYDFLPEDEATGD
jgi:hypothetical protein